IPIFNVPEIITFEPKKIKPTSSNTNHVEKDKPEFPVASSSVSIAEQAVRRFSESWDKVPTDISPPPEIVHVELVDDKSEPVSEIIKPVNDKVEYPKIIELINDPEISPDLPVNNEPKTINEVSPQQISCPPGYQTREQREIRLRQKAIELGEDPDKFVTITEKDRDLARIYYDKMMADAEIIEFARSDGVDPENYMELSRREKLICMEIDLRLYEDKGEPRAYTCIYNDEDWAKNIEILRENGYLW
ncbi:5251_t:CDS:2, partial [Paraglomus brasilianum]